ncbi:DUF5683 domain-containing protein [Daejeonella lutea]|uniref:DUF5683 domain-containing protein n=1 Tax=Daejeonella lutea TaxID=572036 RepID=A0A1T5ERH3_9SPHI|nr:DUF5683 domain-containing protein [Daejeonella lutea]SKB86290.1 hypothetical protein SAMN05661099_3131 [Daejeonella lutea]
MIRKLLSLIFCVCLLTQINAYSQNTDTIPQRKQAKPELAPNGVVKDSARLAIEAMPRIAARRSAMLPGLGQIYNKRWWKVPLVYGGFVGIGLVYEFNQQQYKIFLREAQYRQEDPSKANPAWKGVTDEGIIRVKDNYRRTRDLSILAGVAFYAVQIIDAYIDAKFYRFDVSNDLSIRLTPVTQPSSIYNAVTPVSPGVGFKVRLSL